IGVGVSVEPIQESHHFSVEPWRRWCLKMNLLFAGGTGDNRHWAVLSSRQAPVLIFLMPLKEPFGGELLVIVARSVEHHLNHAVDIPVCGLECADIHTEAARNRGPNLFSSQLLSLDFAAF